MNLGGNSRQRQREAELDRRVKARERWEESEWVLDCLRSKSGTTLKELSEEEIEDWHRRVQRRP